MLTLLLVVFNIVLGISECTSQQHQQHNIYIWKSERGEFISPLNISYGGGDDLKTLAGKTIRVIADNMLPYITSSNESDELGGYLGDIWTIIQTALKFRSQVISVDYDTGLRLIVEGKGDIMLAAAIQRKDIRSIEYSQPYIYNWYHLYVKKPKPTASSSSYLQTLNDGLWIASISLFVCLSCLLWCTMRILSNVSTAFSVVSMSSCILTVCGGILNQGYDSQIQCYSGRIQIFFALIFGGLLYASMNAVLVAKLAIFEFKLPFNSLEEIAEQRTYSLCVRTNSFVYNNFTDANHTLLPEWQQVVNGAGCLNINDQRNLSRVICRDGVAVLENRVVMASVMKKFNVSCEVETINTRFFGTHNSFVLLRTFEYKKLINLYIKRLKNYGVLQRLEKIWLPRAPANPNEVTTSPVTIYHVRGILLMLAIMILMSLAILAIEIMHGRYFTQQQPPLQWTK